ncbi:MAG: 30S ribosomal protein S16 [candidate division TM6 bacterium GW2011_GWE2_41_16]|nr:MAG: 30S ribosomal protein S16 [candidate division TM6 bacterium GW2011_GWE2_41_16]
MAVKIRLSRVGRKHVPFYRIVAIDERRKRDGGSLEVLGTYNALTREIIQYHAERIQAWVAQGAIKTDAVKKIEKLYQKKIATV